MLNGDKSASDFLETAQTEENNMAAIQRQRRHVRQRPEPANRLRAQPPRLLDRRSDDDLNDLIDRHLEQQMLKQHRSRQLERIQEEQLSSVTGHHHFAAADKVIEIKSKSLHKLGF